MPPKNKYSDPKLREEVKEDVKQSDKGGAPGQWSARKAQMMAKEYKARGGEYNTPKSDKDETQKHLDKWTDEDWQTKEGSGNAKKEDGTQRRYLPKKAWEQMNEKEKNETDEKKQKESKEGKQFVQNTGAAKKAREEAQEKDEESEGKEKISEDKSNSKKQKKVQSDKEDDDSQESRTSKVPKTRKQKKDENNSDIQKEAKSPQADSGKKRTRSQTASENAKEEHQKNETSQKKQKDNSGLATKGGGKTIGSKHDKAEAPAQQGSTSRLPKKAQKAHWKAMPGWIDGEVVEVLKSGKKVDGKDVKASKDDPKVVLKSKSSGKICVHKADNVYFD